MHYINPEDEDLTLLRSYVNEVLASPLGKISFTLALCICGNFHPVQVRENAGTEPQLLIKEVGTRKIFKLSDTDLVEEIPTGFYSVSDWSVDQIIVQHRLNPFELNRLAAAIQKLWPTKLTWNENSHMMRVMRFVEALEKLCDEHRLFPQSNYSLVLDQARGDEYLTVSPGPSTDGRYLVRREFKNT